METNAIYYLSYTEAMLLHFELMWEIGEFRIGVADRSLLESTLARPQQAAAYENADLIRQAAYALFWLNQKPSLVWRK